MRHSSTLRLTLLIGLAVTLIAALGGGWLYSTAKSELHARELQLLRADLDGFSDLYDQRRIIALREAIVGRDAPVERMIVLLLDNKGAKLAGNISNWPAMVSASETGFADVPFQHFDWVIEGARVGYMGVARNLPGNFPILVARSTTATEKMLQTLLVNLGLGVLVILAIGLGTGYGVARLVLHRIERVNALCVEVQAGDLSARIPGDRSPDEFGRLEDHVHRMLDRIEQLDRAVHRLGNHIAHELRTPLNRVRQRVEALEGPDDIAAVIAEIESTVQVFDALLDIAAAETDAQAGDRGALQPQDLSSLAREAIDLYDALAQESGIDLTTELASGTAILGDRNLILRLIANLLDNAIKFTPRGGAVQLTVSDTGRGFAMTLADSGPGIPQDGGDRIFERFVRLGNVDQPGHGLGLALVRAIAMRHGARIDLPPADRGFTIRVTWPRFPA